LFWCHTADDRLDAVDVLLINHLGHLAHLLAAWHHLEQVANWAHLADHQQLVEEVIQSELTRTELARGILGLLVVHGGFSLLNKAEHVTHAENTAGHALRVENIEVFELLTGGGKHDWLAGDFTNRQCGTTAGIAIKLSKNHAGKVHAIVERLSGRNRVLNDY